LRLAFAARGIAGFVHRSQQLGAVGRLGDDGGSTPRRGARFFSSTTLRITTGIAAVTGSRCKASSTAQPSKSGIKMSSRMASGLTVRASWTYRSWKIGGDGVEAFLQEQALRQLEKRAVVVDDEDALLAPPRLGDGALRKACVAVLSRIDLALRHADELVLLVWHRHHVAVRILLLGNRRQVDGEAGALAQPALDRDFPTHQAAQVLAER